eukprot:6883916-Pyramimonas_sp.AAC.1
MALYTFSGVSDRRPSAREPHHHRQGTPPATLRNVSLLSADIRATLRVPNNRQGTPLTCHFINLIIADVGHSHDVAILWVLFVRYNQIR